MNNDINVHIPVGGANALAIVLLINAIVETN